MAKKHEYVGERIRKEVKRQRVTNGYLIHALNESGIKMSDSKFSNKIYGKRDTFNEQEVSVISRKLNTDFTI